LTTDSGESTTYYFTLLRHGESVGNAQGRVQGQADFSLTETGRQQAQALTSRWLSEKVTFNHVISSPLARTRETAEIIASALDLPVELNALWMERDYGNLSGLHWDDAVQTEQTPLYSGLYQPVGETGESLWGLYLRGGRALHSLLEYPPGRYLIVSHGGILNMVIYALLGIQPQAYFRGARFLFRNTAFASFIYSPTDHIWRMVGLNDRSHWTGEP
jgi:broad specificity phosphatase PhoE